MLRLFLFLCTAALKVYAPSLSDSGSDYQSIGPAVSSVSSSNTLRNPFEQFNSTKLKVPTFFEGSTHTSSHVQNESIFNKIAQILSLNDQSPLCQVAEVLGATTKETIQLKRVSTNIFYSPTTDIYFCDLPQAFVAEAILKIIDLHRAKGKTSDPKICAFLKSAQDVSAIAYLFQVQNHTANPSILFEKILTYTKPNALPAEEKEAEIEACFRRELSLKFELTDQKIARTLFDNENTSEGSEELLGYSGENTPTNAEVDVDTSKATLSSILKDPMLEKQSKALHTFAHAKRAPWLELFKTFNENEITKINDKVYFVPRLNMYFVMFSKSKNENFTPTLGLILEHAEKHKNENINILASFSFTPSTEAYTSYLGRYFKFKAEKGVFSTGYSLKAYKIPTCLNRAPKDKHEEYIESKVKEILKKFSQKGNLVTSEEIVSSEGLYKQYNQYLETCLRDGNFGVTDSAAQAQATSQFLREENIATWHRLNAMFRFGFKETDQIVYKKDGKSAAALVQVQANPEAIKEAINRAKKEILGKHCNSFTLFMALKQGEYDSPFIYQLLISNQGMAQVQKIHSKINPAASSEKEQAISEAYKNAVEKELIVSN